MTIKVTLTEEEILVRPNHYELGKFVQEKYWQAKRDQEGHQFDGEHFDIPIDENGLVTSINVTHEYDTCIICGKVTPYLRNTHIDSRINYIEGMGQACSICYKK
jgi:hypothetical protein